MTEANTFRFGHEAQTKRNRRPPSQKKHGYKTGEELKAAGKNQIPPTT